MTLTGESFDVAVVGAGIVGLAHALACARRGLKVVVIDRDAQANGASIRNFGFVTISGQAEGAMWRRACRSREIWLEVARAARIDIHQRGMLMVARRPEAAALLGAFAFSPMGSECEMISDKAARRRFPQLAPGLEAALFSPHEIRVDPQDAIARIAAYLAAEHGVAFLWSTAAIEVEPGKVRTSRGAVQTAHAIVAPGDDATTLFPELLASYGLTRCKLQMMRVRPANGTLPHVLMSDLSLVRYAGFASLPQAAALRARLEVEAERQLGAGVHLIVAASRDGTCVIGDSHVYGLTPDPFGDEAIDRMILDEYEAVLGHRPEVVERWTGTYASSSGPEPVIVAAPAPEIRLVTVATGAGMSCSFALAEEVVGEMGL